jgi:predicted nucleic acid-binding protein
MGAVWLLGGRAAPAPDRPGRAVAIDTNVFVAAAFHPRSSAAQLIERVRSGSVQMVWSEATRQETQAVLRRIPRVAWEPFADLFRAEWEHRSEADPEAFAAVPDPAARKFDPLAAAAKAVLVTNDRLLRDGARAEGLDAVSPAQFLAREAAAP